MSARQGSRKLLVSDAGKQIIGSSAKPTDAIGQHELRAGLLCAEVLLWPIAEAEDLTTTEQLAGNSLKLSAVCPQPIHFGRPSDGAVDQSVCNVVFHASHE